MIREATIALVLLAVMIGLSSGGTLGAIAPSHSPSIPAAVCSGPAATGGLAHSPVLTCAGPMVAKATAHAKYITTISPGSSSSIISVGSGIYIEDWSNGSLYHWSKSLGLTFVTTAPSGGVFDGYWGMADGTVGGIFAIYLISFTAEGLYACAGATATGCSSLSAFIPLPATFCSKMPAGYCHPDGLAFYNGNLYYADLSSDVEVELYGATGFTSAAIYHTFPSGAEPDGIFIDSSGNHWIADASCSGHVYKDGVLYKSVGDELESIAVVKGNVYVGDNGICHGTVGHIANLTSGKSLPTVKGAGAFEVPTFSTNFYFTYYSVTSVYKA